MALTFSREGDEPSGEFTRVTEWSCPYHDRDVNPIGDYGEPDPEWEPGEFCNSCLAAGWRKLYNPDGSPMMREMSKSEVWQVEMWKAIADSETRRFNRFAELMQTWNEDEKIPRIVWLEDSIKD